MLRLVALLVITRLTFTLSDSSACYTYENYSIYAVETTSTESVIPESQKSIYVVLNQRRQCDSNGRTRATATYLVPPNKGQDFQKLVEGNENVRCGLVIGNLGPVIKEEKWQASYRSGGSFYESYHSYNEMLSYLHSLKKLKNRAGQTMAQIEFIGKTTENRDMVLVKISSDHSAKKPIIFFEAGIHGREWLAPTSAMYMIDQLVHNITQRHVLDGIDFYIIPLSNPDGYEYSREYDRLWRKTRSKHNGFYGVDGNRNFDFHWKGEGASDLPQSEIYRGPTPFSEPETRHIRDVGKKYSKRINTFVSLHCFGPFIVYPWGYQVVEDIPQGDLMDKMAREAAEAIRKFSGTNYRVGMSSKLLYDSPGGSDDYFKGVLGVNLAFTIEISPAGKPSFIVHPSKITKITSELFEGIKVLAKYAAAYKPT
ncbi:hypothetical protein RUM43_002832 [Polyplax serrata]|uniref:Peptidase M14 domain-containing protein n=1 Tax=Polyplax serrata TaxID=468196 RepID=A0AAN8S2U1_POLSC